MELILKQCNITFRSEWGIIVDQYNDMRNAVYTAEQTLFLSESQKHYLENEVNQLKSLLAETRPTQVADYVEDFAPNPELYPGLDEEALNEANCILEKPFNFYGGYLMQVMYKKNEVLTNTVVQKLMGMISKLRHEKKLMETNQAAINNVAVLNFDLAQADADRIKVQAKEISDLKKLIVMNAQLVKKEKKQIYWDMKKKSDALHGEYHQFR